MRRCKFPIKFSWDPLDTPVSQTHGGTKFCVGMSTSDCSLCGDDCMMNFCLGKANFRCKLRCKKGAWGCIGICGDAWGGMKIAVRRYQFFCGDEENERFCVRNVWGHPHALFFAWGAPQANLFAWGFVWGGFAWVCDTGVSLASLPLPTPFPTNLHQSYMRSPRKILD